MEEHASEKSEDIHASVHRDLQERRVKSNWNWILVSPIFVDVGALALHGFVEVSCVKTAAGMSMWIACVNSQHGHFHAGRFSHSLEWRIVTEPTSSCLLPHSRRMVFYFIMAATMKDLTFLPWKFSIQPWGLVFLWDLSIWRMLTQGSPCLMDCGTQLKSRILIRFVFIADINQFCVFLVTFHPHKSFLSLFNILSFTFLCLDCYCECGRLWCYHVAGKSWWISTLEKLCGKGKSPARITMQFANRVLSKIFRFDWTTLYWWSTSSKWTHANTNPWLCRLHPKRLY